MKINTIPLLHSYNNSSCNRFWEGYFNYSGRQWVVMHSKDKEIQAVEIHDPRAHSQNTLKIILLFTLIVPIIAAIYHFIKLCHFRKFHVTLITPHPKTSQIRQPQEEQATLTHLPEKSFKILEPTEEVATLTIPEDKPILPLNADEAYEYILNSKEKLKGDTLKLLQNLEKFPIKKANLIRTLGDFPKLKEVEISYDDIHQHNLSWISELKNVYSLTFIGNSFEKNKSIPNIIWDKGDELISLLNDSTKVLYHLLVYAASPQLKEGRSETFNGKLFNAILTDEHLPKFNEEELGILFDYYGKYLLVMNNQNIINKGVHLNLLQILPPTDLFPYIFKAKNTPKELLRLLMENLQVYTCELLQTTLTNFPDLLEPMFNKFQDIAKPNKAYAIVFIAYISSRKIYRNPDEFLRLIRSYPTSDLLHQILASKEGEFASYEISFVDNLKALVLHKDVTEEIRLQFFEEFSEESVTARFILEFASDEKNLKQLKESCEKEWADPIFNFGLWRNFKKDHRAYILLVRCLNSMKEKTADFTSMLLKARPLFFRSSAAKPFSFYPVLLAIDILDDLLKTNLLRDYNVETFFQWSKELALITPLEKLELLTKSFLNVSLLPSPLAKITAIFVTYVLNHRDETAVKTVLKGVLPKLYDYFHHEFSALKDLLHAFDNPFKLEYALDCLLDLPSNPREGLLALFSKGIVTYEDQKEVKLKINIHHLIIEKVFNSKGIKESPRGILNIMDLLSLEI